MVSFNPLFKNDLFSGARGHFGGRHHAMGHHHGLGQLKQSAPVVPVANGVDIERTLAVAYQKLQVTSTSKLSSTDSSTATQAATPTGSDNDFSPQAVTDRILGFVSDRLEAEKQNGASEEDLKALYQQAVSGIEKGLREAKDIIQANGLFSGSVKDNFDATVNKLADGLEAMGESLFGTEIGAPEPAGITYQSSAAAFERSRSFEMEVVTQDGDTIKLLVNSGQSGYANQFSLQGEGLQAEGYDAGFTRYDNVSFAVEGELDEGEIAALKDLFQQVNSIADTFYGGNVEQAFDQAMNVGMNTDELAAFAVDIQQSQTVAVRDTYVAIDNMAGAGRNGFNDVLPRLGEFASQTRAASDVVASLDGGRIKAQDLLRDLVSRFHSDADTRQGYGDAFKQYVAALA